LSAFVWQIQRKTMSDKTNQSAGDTVRLRRPPPRVFTDVLGQNVWMGEVEPLELELEQLPSSDPYNNATLGGHWSKL
jgi:hypothetical protein